MVLWSAGVNGALFSCVPPPLQLTRWVEDLSSRSDSQPCELKLNDLSLSREDGDKYTVLTGIPVKALRFRIGVMQVRWLPD